MGPLDGVRVVEIAGIGPAPCCGMILADLGAEVILVERQSKNPNAPEVEAQITGSSAFYKRSKKSIALDLKQPESVATVLQLVGRVVLHRASGRGPVYTANGGRRCGRWCDDTCHRHYGGIAACA